MIMTAPFSAALSEQWLLERTYHAQLRNGGELSVPKLTHAMKQITSFYVPLSTWREITQEEARAAPQQGIPVLLYDEHPWEHSEGATKAWSANKNMRVVIFGNARMQPEVVSGTEYAVCYLDPKRGTFSNAVWKGWFASDLSIFEDGDRSTITFLAPDVLFPYTTHYTVIAADGNVQGYATSAEAVRGFQRLPPPEVGSGSQVQMASPQFSFYHEVTCPSGVYRLAFFGPRMDEPGYKVQSGRTREG